MPVLAVSRVPVPQLRRRAIYDVHARVPRPLIEAAKTAPDVPAGLGLGALVRLALAKLAGWPDAAARTVARVPDEKVS